MGYTIWEDHQPSCPGFDLYRRPALKYRATLCRPFRDWVSWLKTAGLMNSPDYP